MALADLDDDLLRAVGAGLGCADLLVSKSAGLSLAEAAALGVPMIVLDPIPGQEQRNADVLLEAGAALKINDLPLIASRVDAVLANGGAKRAAMASAILQLGRPQAAFVVADAVLAQGAKGKRE